MKCRNCSGELYFENNTLKCKNCGSVFSANEYYVETEVYSCYIETDEGGRRTKDSAIAQEIHSILEDNHVKSFCRRVSMDGLTGDVAQTVDAIALSNAKVVLLIGTSKEHLSLLWEENKERFEGKKIVPVYYGMNGNDIPAEIKGIQALKYDSVGASKDIIRVVSKFVGNNFTDEDYQSRHDKQKKRTIIIVVVVIVALLVIIGICITNKKKDEQDTTIDTGAVDDILPLDENSLYEQAVGYKDNDKYADAIEILSKLGDYKDSETLLRTCYMKYAGYYYDEKTDIYFRLQIIDKNNASIEVYKTNDKGNRCTINANVSFQGCVVETSSVDGDNNTYDIALKLDNTGIEVSIMGIEISGDTYIPDSSITCQISEKNDRPISKEVTYEYLKEILNGKTTIDDIQKQGYEVSMAENSIIYGDSEEDLGDIYRFNNTDIYLYIPSYDITQYIVEDETAPDYEPVICVIKAPAGLVASDKIGSSITPYVEDECIIGSTISDVDSVYLVSGELDLSFDCYADTEVTESTPIIFCSKKSIGLERYDKMIMDCVIPGRIQDICVQEKGFMARYPWILSETDEYYDMEVKEYDKDGNSGIDELRTVYYRIYKEDYRIEEISDDQYISNTTMSNPICGVYETYVEDEGILVRAFIDESFDELWLSIEMRNPDNEYLLGTIYNGPIIDQGGGEYETWDESYSVFYFEEALYVWSASDKPDFHLVLDKVANSFGEFLGMH